MKIKLVDCSAAISFLKGIWEQEADSEDAIDAKTGSFVMKWGQ
ncbi:hypothetical protein [Paenibacillus monticola]|nr:hypothetical protein [Paenibacillus monticola]